MLLVASGTTTWRAIVMVDFGTFRKEKLVFPNSVLLKHGWIVWFKGIPENRERSDNATVAKHVKPLRLMSSKSLPKNCAAT